MDDLLELLQQAKAEVALSKRLNDPNQSKVEWKSIPITYHCLQCKREYKGMLHTCEDITQKETPWCPRCLDERLWWLHSGFSVEEVIEPMESVRNSNS